MIVQHESWQWSNLTREDVRTYTEPIIIVPVGSTEQHGYHLPTTTDSILVTHVANRLAARYPQQLLVIPTVTLGFSPHHFPYAGTLSLSADTLMHVLLDIASSLNQTGFHKIWFLNGHGGNDEIIRLAARMASQQWPLTAAACSYWTLALDSLREVWVSDAETTRVPLPGHAGRFETALMLTIAPNLVQWTHLPSETKEPYLADPYLVPRGSFQQFDGYTDDPRSATKELGEKCLTIVLDALTPIVRSLAEGT